MKPEIASQTVPSIGDSLNENKVKIIQEAEESNSQLFAAKQEELEKTLQLLQKSEDEKEHLIKVLGEYHTEIGLLSDDNTTLRTQIVGMLTPQDPINDDGFYKQQLTELNETIKSWVAGSFKSKQRDHDLSDAEENQILQFLKSRGNVGSDLSLIFCGKGTIRTIFHVPRRRMAFVRCLLSIYLCDYVFTPFCFGLDEEIDLLMHGLLSSTLENGACLFRNITNG